MRAFIAFELPAYIKTYLSKTIDAMSSRTDNVKWVRYEGLHITLKFLGEIDDSVASDIRDGLMYLETKYRPFTMSLDRIDAFPDRKMARVIVVRLKNEIDIISNIFKDIEDNLEKFGFEREKRVFKPHITLGRRKTPLPLLEKAIIKLDEMDFSVDSVVMFKSTLTSQGAIYDPIWKINLGGINS
ncbi:MAG: RNA 2',3'-cyclic phosphodiesterase [Syntrophorhabdaceae bacterium]|nr:RNA 2',3'-cyclic phosphodiesterase [Syntrophorhabdaceae bacterium]